MNFETVQNLIRPELYALIPVLYIVGAILKKTSFCKDNFIPLVLLCVSVTLCVIWTFAAQDASGANIFASLFAGLIQGVLCAGAAVFSNQMYKQLSKLE